MEFVVGWLLFSIIPAVVAANKGRSIAGWFFLSLLVSPLFAGILVALLPAVVEENEAEARAPCPQCAEQILHAAKICPHCRSSLEPGWNSKRRYLSRPA